MMFIIILPYLAFLFLAERFHLNHALAIILGFLGVFFIITEGDISRLGSGDALGIFILLVTATAYAFYQLSTSKFTRFVMPQVDSISLFYSVMILISIFSLISALIFQPTGFYTIKSDAWIWIVLLAIFSTIIAFTSYFEASKGIQANTLSILLVSQALVPFFVDIFLLGREYSIWIYSGGFIVIIAMIIVGKTPTEDINKFNDNNKYTDQSTLSSLTD